MLLHGDVSGAKRIVRHLWRMSFAFWIAAFSFFLGQQKVMPAYFHGVEAALRTASADTNRVDLLAVSRVVHKYVQAQTNYCQADSCRVVNSFWRYLQ